MMYEEELRQDAETGRRYRIAMEVWREFLDDRKAAIVELFENDIYSTEDYELYDLLAELRVMKRFRNVSHMNIGRGEIAEGKLGHGE